MRDSPVRRLEDERDDGELVAVAARAFWHDPLFDFLTNGDLLDEYRVLPHVFRTAMTDSAAPRPRCTWPM